MQKNKIYFGACFKLHFRGKCKFAGPNVGERKHVGRERDGGTWN